VKQEDVVTNLQIAMVVIAGIFTVLYMMRRRARLGRED
jgi:hypothetical protein